MLLYNTNIKKTLHGFITPKIIPLDLHIQVKGIKKLSFLQNLISELKSLIQPIIDFAEFIYNVLKTIFNIAYEIITFIWSVINFILEPFKVLFKIIGKIHKYIIKPLFRWVKKILWKIFKWIAKLIWGIIKRIPKFIKIAIKIIITAIKIFFRLVWHTIKGIAKAIDLLRSWRRLKAFTKYNIRKIVRKGVRTYNNIRSGIRTIKGIISGMRGVKGPADILKTMHELKDPKAAKNALKFLKTAKNIKTSMQTTKLARKLALLPRYLGLAASGALAEGIGVLITTIAAFVGWWIEGILFDLGAQAFLPLSEVDDKNKYIKAIVENIPIFDIALIIDDATGGTMGARNVANYLIDNWLGKKINDIFELIGELFEDADEAAKIRKEKFEKFNKTYHNESENKNETYFDIKTYTVNTEVIDNFDFTKSYLEYLPDNFQFRKYNGKEANTNSLISVLDLLIDDPYNNITVYNLVLTSYRALFVIFKNRSDKIRRIIAG